MKTINYIIYLLVFIIVCVLIYTFVVKNDNTKIEKLIVKSESISVEIKESKKIDVYIENNSNAIPNFQSADESIATVSSDGIVTGIKKGITTIIISYTSKNGNLTSKCDVIVNDTKGKTIINSISFPKDDLLLGVGNQFLLNYTLEPNNTPNSIEFISSNENVARIDKTGLIEGISSGNAVIRVIVNNNVYKDLNVYVRDGVSTSYVVLPTDIKVSNSSIVLMEGGEEKLSFEIFPTDASKDIVKVTSSNEDILKYDNGMLKGIKEGKAIITLESANNVVTYINVEVINKEVKVDGISILSNNLLSINVNETSQIIYNITPSNATNKEVIFESLSPNVATVSQTGMITGISKGDAYILLTTKDGGYQLYVKVTVNSTSSSNNGNNDNNGNNNGKSGVNTACNTSYAEDAEFNKCFLVSRQLNVDKTTVSIPAGGTAYVKVSLPSSCGTLVRWTRKSADGEKGWSNYVTQSRTNETNTGFTWVINAKSSAKGKTVLVSQTVQYDSLSPSGTCTGNVKSMKTITVNIT